jgi:hypothetical protein
VIRPFYMGRRSIKRSRIKIHERVIIRMRRPKSEAHGVATTNLMIDLSIPNDNCSELHPHGRVLLYQREYS